MTEPESRIRALEAAIFNAYRARTAASRAWHDRAARSLVGGVSGTVRYFHPYPLYFAEGQGAWASDIDGNRYVDHFLCGACLLPGHRHPAIMSAIAGTHAHGSLVLNDRLSTELAERLQAIAPAAERVRLLNSGTEAVMSALRFARAFTGRAVVVKFHGTYHGQGDDMLVGLDARARSLGAGVTDSAVAGTRLAEFGNFDQLGIILERGDIAAVLVDPSMHHCGLWAGDAETYRRIQKMTREAGALLVFDEVISGFRLAAGGAQTYFGVTPDLAVYAKAFGAGEKIGAVAGRADVMAVADPSRRTQGPFAFQSGTGNDVRNSVAAAIAALELYAAWDADGAYRALAARADRLGQGLQNAFASRGIACHYNALGPMVRLFLTDGPKTLKHCLSIDNRVLSLFHCALLTDGVLTIPGSNDFFLSFAHGDEEIDFVIAAANAALDRFDFASVSAIPERSANAH
ncbi:MAG: aminotransferase class III-fold pyridoxal phosphate-dependent enzyme [Hyphomonadaceae bacterium]|nr:MAG: glutamate-1-semialdehyde 2 1-aminomutase [Caulobacteraceae bacterium]MBT9445851.1 aminotransferase class III-fold pyridoxal phosphate-dependent enzyme [Hyphomonadaceae bacterium]